MNYHVFIVDSTTFKSHLEYLFAGTGAGDKRSPFIELSNDTTTHWATEKNLVGMIADVSKIRIGDKIIFYLQASGNRQGYFFGIFKATSQAFFDENDENNYLKNELNKSLSFRIRIEPDIVFPFGVSEHQYLDSLDNISFPYQMCWSLIYRKLKGNRGCTMITEQEFDLLKTKLNSVNNGRHYVNNVRNFTYKDTACVIEPIDDENKYIGRQKSLAIRNRLLYKSGRGDAFEVHLQAFLLQQFDSDELRNVLLPYPDKHCWIGNEVSCGVGMQRIDILVQQEIDNDIFLKVIELKCVQPEEYILSSQLPWYIKWLSEYIVPNYTAIGKKVHIIPCVIAKDGDNDNFINKSKLFSNTPTNITNYDLEPLEFFSFSSDDAEIKFRRN